MSEVANTGLVEARAFRPTLAEEWGRCRHYIEAALAHSPGFETIEDVERHIESGAYQFWPGIHCAAITEIAQFTTKKMLVMQHVGGDLDELLHRMEPHLCAFARAAGCDGIMGLGREGWKRVGEKLGYRLAWVALMKYLKQ